MNAQSLLITHPRRKISLTALIDVVFILLMFFMLTSSFIQYGTLTLSTPTASLNAVNEHPQLLRLSTNGSVSIVGANELPDVSLIEAMRNLNLSSSIVLLPHADMNLQEILAVFESLTSGGAEQLSLGETWGESGE